MSRIRYSAMAHVEGAPSGWSAAKFRVYAASSYPWLTMRWPIYTPRRRGRISSRRAWCPALRRSGSGRGTSSVRLRADTSLARRQRRDKQIGLRKWIGSQRDSITNWYAQQNAQPAGGKSARVSILPVPCGQDRRLPFLVAYFGPRTALAGLPATTWPIQNPFLKPVEEVEHRAVVRRPGVRVPDLCREEFDEAAGECQTNTGFRQVR